ncbi:GreA/GreB family elongation factor [Microvirga mediterraneensis]
MMLSSRLSGRSKSNCAGESTECFMQIAGICQCRRMSKPLGPGCPPAPYLDEESISGLHDDMTGRKQTVSLAYPHESGPSKRRVSMLTPIGTALIGRPVESPTD